MFARTGFVLAVVTFFSLLVGAVYDDEAFKTDWHLQQLGGNIARSALTDTNYVTISSGGILTVIDNLNKGEIKWRQQLLRGHYESSADSIFLETFGDNLIVTATQSSFEDIYMLQVWNQSNSFLIKEFELTDLDAIKVVQKVNGKTLVIVGSLGQVSVLDTNALTLTEVATLANPTDSVITNIAVFTLSNGNIAILVNNFQLSLLDGSSYAVISSVILPDYKMNIGKLLRIFQNKIFYQEATSESVEVFIVNDNSDLTKMTHIKTGYEVSQFSLLDLNSYLLIDNFDYYSSSSIKDKSSLQYAKTIDEHSVIVFSHNAIQVLDSEFGIEHVKYVHNLNINFDDVKSIKVAYNAQQNHKINAVLEFGNGHILSINNDLQLWVRDEALSQVVDYVVFDPSKNLNSQLEETEHLKNYLLEEESSVWVAFIKRWSTHIQQLYRLDSFIRNAGVSDYLAFVLGKNVQDQAKKIEFGLNKQLVILTKNNKIVNLELENGNINWKFDQLVKFIGQSNAKITNFLNNNNKYLEIWFSNGNLLAINPSTGVVEKFIEGKIPANQKVIPVNLNNLLVEGENSNSTLAFDDDLIIKSEDKDHSLKYVASNNEANIASQDQLNKDFYFVTLEDAATHLQAYKFNPHSKDIVATWNYKTSYPNEKIIATSFNTVNPNSKSPIGIILGDKSVLYKYLYPNLIAFAIHNEAENMLLINVVDSVTGKLIKSVSHLANEEIDLQTASLQLLISDNFLIYSFYSYSPSISTKINVIEFFESKYSNDKTVSSSTGEETLSVLDVEIAEPFVKFKSYNFPFKIDKLILSRTKYDITTKNLILKLENGQIILLPKFLLSSRRVEGRELTKEEKSEFMMIPYDPNIPINNNAVISHKRLIFGLSSTNEYEHMFSVATNLESTSIVCYLNNDIFCTKIYPSLQFDVLSSSFNKVKLLITVVGLLALHLFTNNLVQNKKLNSFWVDKY